MRKLNKIIIMLVVALSFSSVTSKIGAYWASSVTIVAPSSTLGSASITTGDWGAPVLPWNPSPHTYAVGDEFTYVHQGVTYVFKVTSVSNNKLTAVHYDEDGNVYMDVNYHGSSGKPPTVTIT